MTGPRIRVPVPAETGGEDRLVGSLTFRHAAYLAVAAAGVAVMLLGDRSGARVAVGGAVATAGLVGALCRPYGEPVDRLAVAAVGYLLHCARRPAADPASAEHEETLAEDELPVPTESVPPATGRRLRVSPVVVRRLVVALALAGIAALATTRVLDRPSHPPEQRVVIVPVPVNPPDPWQEVDRAFDEWLRSLG